MPINYRDDWDAIQASLIDAGSGLTQERAYAQDAIKIKFAVESIEQQKRMTELQASLLRTTKGLTWATIGLAVFTAALVLATVFPRCV